MVTKNDIKNFYTLKNKPLIVGIAGTAGVGKTTLSENLKALYPDLIEVMHLDDYIISKKTVKKLGFDHSDPRVVDYKKFLKHLYALSSGKSAKHNQEYSFAVSSIVKKERFMSPRPVIVCEGWVLFHYKALRDIFNVRIYLDLPTAQRVSRVISRDILAREGNITEERMYYLKNVSPPLQEKYAKPQARYATHKFYSINDPNKLAGVVLSALKPSIS